MALALVVVTSGCAATALSSGSEFDRTRAEVTDQLAVLLLAADVADRHGPVPGLDVTFAQARDELASARSTTLGMAATPDTARLLDVLDQVHPVAAALESAAAEGDRPGVLAARRELVAVTDGLA